MAIKDLLPSFRRKRVPIRREEYSPIDLLHEEIDSVFERFFRGFGIEPFISGREFSPRVDVAEGEKAVEITAELPGMDENDIDVSISEGLLTIKGEKKMEREDRDKDYYRVERSYGAFTRTIPIPEYVDLDKAEASFKKGVLKITLPKLPEAVEKKRKIQIKVED